MTINFKDETTLSYFNNATKYYYSETNPFENDGVVTNDNYWHYDADGKTILIWTKQ